MKKNLFSFVLLLSVVALCFQSCDKIKDNIKANINPINYSQPEISFTVPKVVTAELYKSGEQTYVININEIIKDNASGVDVDIDDISKISLNKVTLKLLDGDEANNWTNFDYVAAVFNTDKGRTSTKPELYSLVGIDDVADQQYSDKVIEFDDVNLKDYFNGENTTIYYNIETKARRATNKEVTVKAIIEYTFEF